MHKMKILSNILCSISFSLLIAGFILLPVACCPPPEELPDIGFDNIEATDITSTSVQISWTTTYPSTSYVEYGTTIDYGNETVEDTTLTTSHVVLISGLSPATLYHYRIRFRIPEDENTTVLGPDRHFTTLQEAAGYLYDELPDEVMPIVYLSGTEYEMGYQYGQQAGEYVEMVKDGRLMMTCGWRDLLCKILFN